jgi:hypothetical protein
MEREPSGVVLHTGDLQNAAGGTCTWLCVDMDGMWACACSKTAGMHCGVGVMMGVPGLCACKHVLMVVAGGCISWCMPHACEKCQHAAWVALWVHMSWQGMLAACWCAMCSDVARCSCQKATHGQAARDRLAGGEQCRRLLASIASQAHACMNGCSSMPYQQCKRLHA